MVGQRSVPSNEVDIDDTRWPIVELRLPPRPIADAEFERTIRTLLELTSRGGRFGFVVDARQAPEPDAKRRSAIGELMDSLQKAHGAAFIGVAIAPGAASVGLLVVPQRLGQRSAYHHVTRENTSPQ